MAEDTDNKEMLIYQGTVVSANLTEQTYVVTSAKGGELEDCICALGPFAGMLGIKSTFRPSIGSRVLVWKGQSNFIISCFPGDLPDAASHAGRSITNCGTRDLSLEADQPSTDSIPMHNAPQDLFDGEYEMGFLQGGFIRFLMMMTSLGGNERAQIQFHVLRDLVRLISGNFEHFSAFGDEVIMDDGQVSIEVNGTPVPYERLGLENEGDPLDMPADDFDGEAFNPLRTGRWRYTKMLGFLGGQLNEWFTHPMEAAGEMVNTAFRSGLHRNHVGPEGEVLIQSVTEIALERVVRIPVPIRLKHHEDPEGVLREQFKDLDTSFLKTWPQKKGQAGHHSLFLLRDYARWLAQYHSLARIHQLAAKAGEFHVPSEFDTPEPEIGKHDEDVRKANADNTYWKDTYATIRIGREGSILLLDGYHNSYHSGPHGINIDTPRHLRLTVGGDMSAIVGGNFLMRARRNIEMVAEKGGFMAIARGFWKAVSTKGAMLLCSESDPGNKAGPDGDIPAPEYDDNNYGLVITSPKAGVHIEAGKGMKLSQTDADSSFEIDNVGQSRIELVKELDLILRKGAIVDVGPEALQFNGGRTVFRNYTEVVFENSARFYPAGADINILKTTAVTAQNGFTGPSDKVIKRAQPGLGNDAPDTSMPVEVGTPVRVAGVDIDELTWGAMGTEEYAPQDSEEDLPEDAKKMFEPLGQQNIRLEAPTGYATWTFDTTFEGDRASPNTKFFPKGQQWMRGTPAEGALKDPSNTAPSTMGSLGSVTLQSSTLEFNYLER